MKSYRKFDAQAYWANKPLCIVCKNHKVKSGTVCSYCKQEVMKQDKKISTTTKTEDNSTAVFTDKTTKMHSNVSNQEAQQKISQIKFDKNFVKRLLDKLKVGNARSIHLNVIPGRSAIRLDLCQLMSVDQKMPFDFIETILNNESFSFSISYDKIDLGKIDEEEKKRLALISKRLNAIVIENEDNFLEFGLKNFGFGYPILIKRDRNDPTKIIKAPLFIWQLDIQRSYQNKNTWTIKKEEDSPIKINELLVSHLSKDESVQIEKISEKILEDGILDQNELIALSKNILSQLNSQVDNLEIKIEKCPDAKQVEAIANSKPWIQWSGVFGLYRSQNETIIHSTEELLERFEEFESEKLVLEKFQTSTISAVETDPSKEEIVNTLTKDEIKLIQGPPGTGKSQSITAIVSNALANNATCLIVCEKKTALDVIHANLEKIGLEDFSMVIDDVNKDRKKTIERARNIKECSHNTLFSESEFNDKYNKFCQLKGEINSKHAESLKKVFGDFSWKQLIGLYLRFSKSGDIDQINSILDYRKLEFSHKEYSTYLSLVEEGSFLFGDLENNAEGIFQMLDHRLFSIGYKWATQEKIKDETSKFLEIIENIYLFLSNKEQNDCEEKNVSLFVPKTVEESGAVVLNAIENLEEIINLYEQGIALNRSSFNSKGYWQDLLLSLSSIANAENRKIFTIRKKISVLYDSVSKSILEMEKFNFEIRKMPDFKEYNSYEQLKSNVSEVLSKVRSAESKIKMIQAIEIKLKQAETNLAKIKKDEIFDFELINYGDLGSHESVCKYYLELKNKIEKIKSYLDSYESFHNWKYFCSNKNEFELQILSAFKRFPVENWKNIFNAWYYRGALLNYESNTGIGFHKSDSKLQQLTVLYKELEKQQIKQIKSVWNDNRNHKLSEITFNFNTLYNLRRNNAGPKNSLRNIIEKDFDLFTTLFPVILTNPAAANAILPLKQGLFNIVIFDEASQLRIPDTFTSLIRGQYKIIAGDEHQMPPSNYFQSTIEALDLEEKEDNDDVFNEEDEQNVLAESESLLQYATDLQNINKSYLDFHYRSNHPALIEFSNSAFYGGNLISFPAQEVYKPIEFRAVNGRYETRTNPAEIAEILKIIRDEIHPDQKGKYPSVGIATFNINQRNLITEALNEVAENDSEFAIKLQELRERGLFVKNLENIQGDEKDIIIISTTYGIKPDGTFSQNFARLNRIEGYKLLNVLITRAKHKLYVCTSIPKDKYLAYSEIIKNEGNNKKGILYAYLAYAEAISNHDNECADNILKLLKTQSFEKPRIISSTDGLSESPFEEEVYELLLDHFEKDNIIQQYKVGGFRLDFVIKTGSKDVVLECDGKAYHSSEEAYAYDMYRQKELENMGFIVYRIWSTNWFQDKEGEIKKLLRFVESLEK
ncbi:MAG: AAA domain-containing protein [Patescibacteria group bacterium]